MVAEDAWGQSVEEEEKERWAIQHPRYDDSDDDDMPDEQWNIYFEAVNRTNGFDVPHIPYVSVCGQIMPLNMSSEKNVKLCEEFSKRAIDKYNEQLKDTEGELEFVEVLRGMGQCVTGMMYYLTFNAKNLAKGSRVITYQAVVLDGLREIEVPSFRVKPDQDGDEVTTKKWFWQSHPGA